MRNRSLNSLIRNGWRSLLLHPFFYNVIASTILIIEASTIVILNINEDYTAIDFVNPITLIIALLALALSIKGKYKQVVMHTILMVSILLPAINIIFNGADLRLAIYGLPLAYLYQLGASSHSLNKPSYAVYNTLLLIGFLYPMTRPIIVVESQSVGIQIILIIIVLITGGLFLTLYSWRKTKSFLLTNEKRLIDKIGSLIEVFSKILIKDDEVDTVLANVAARIIPNLEFEDCVIYLLDEEENVLIQKSAFGSKLDIGTQNIINPIIIPVGKGIVGTVAQTGKPEIIKDTSKDERYIKDDVMRYSELCVPILANQKVIGVIDSEHSSKNFFNEVHLYLLEIIASQCATKIIEINHRSIHQQSIKLEIESKKLHETNKVKSRFISNLSHDLKTPLTLILGPSKELSKLEFDAKHTKLVESINKNGKKLKQIIDELLGLNEMAFLSQNSSFKTFDFGLLMTTWGEKLKQRCLQKDIELLVVGDPKLNTYLDRKKTSIIIHNLFDNALKFTPASGKIIIRYGLETHGFYWTIEDSGDGVPASNRDRIFRRFYQDKNIKEEGSGIGLSIVKQLVTSMNGNITVGESTLGGAEFKLVLYNTFPVETQADNLSISKPTPVLEKQIVLIIEDHYDLRQFIQSSLEEEFICISAKDGERGLELAQKFLPDIIVTDLMLPGISGEDVCRSIRNDQHINHIPIIVLSAKSMTLERVELYQLGAENYLTKPFEIEELRAIIRNNIQQRLNFRASFKSNFISDKVKTRQDPFIAHVITLIEQHLDEHDFNIKALSAEIKIGRNQLQRKIKMLTNMTPVEFLRSVRLKKANELLKKGELSISEVAYAVGFNNLSYFTRSFKQTYNTLPSTVLESAKTKGDGN